LKIVFEQAPGFMVNYVATGFFIFCFIVIIYVISAYIENKKMGPQKGEKFDDDEEDKSFRS
jgi:p-aminobenzoyl-glutamate transporter AbgT